MSFQLDDLKAQMSKRFGPARPNRYRVFFPSVEFATAAEDMSIMCDSVNMPGRQILTNERYTDMKARKVPYGFASEDVSISFILMNDWSAWTYLNDWHRQVIGNINQLGGYTVNFKDDYAKDIEIEHLNYNNQGASQIAKRILLKNAFPSTLNTVELSNSSESEIIRVSASFSYDNWSQYDIRNVEVVT